jgi:hypothetical protein
MNYCRCGHQEIAHEAQRCLLCLSCAGFEDGASEYTASLLALAEPALATAKKRLERNPSFDAYFDLKLPDGELIHFKMPEWAGQLMNIGGAKDRLFAFVRETAQEAKATAVVLVTDQFYSRSTPKACADLKAGRVTEAELKRLGGLGDGFEEMERRGYADRGECLGVTVQTPERAMMLQQAYERFGRREIVWREMWRFDIPIDQFQGRQKMFGDLRAENLR